MTESGHREQRVQESGVVGHSFDTDDRLEDLDIYEALVNPHDEGQGKGKGSGSGGPSMMPPMGGAGGSSKAGTAGASGVEGTGATRTGTSAASAGTGAPGLGGAGALGGSSAGGLDGLGSGGIGAGAQGGPAGLGGLSGLGAGASTWSMPRVGTGAAGLDLSDPGPVGTGGIPGYTIDPGLNPGSSTVPGAGGLSTPTVPATSPSASPVHSPTISAPSAPHVTVPAGSAGGGGGTGSSGLAGGAGSSAGTGALGVKPVQASPEQLRKEAEHWDQTAQDFSSSVVTPLNSAGGSSIGFGMMTAAYQPYSDVLTRMRAWASSGGQEFSNISDALNAAAGGYQDTEGSNVSATTQIA